MKILKTQNKTWGFWGTASNHIEHKKEMQVFWDKAAEIIQSKGLTPQQTLGLMDSRWGRHIADEFAEELSTNLETFASVFKRQMSTIRLIKEFRYYVDPKAFPDVSSVLSGLCPSLKKRARKRPLKLFPRKARTSGRMWKQRKGKPKSRLTSMRWQRFSSIKLRSTGIYRRKMSSKTSVAVMFLWAKMLFGSVWRTA